MEYLAALLKAWWAGIFVPMFWFMWKKIDNTYSKEEVEKHIDLRVQPLSKAIDRNTNATDSLTQVMADLRVDMAQRKND